MKCERCKGEVFYQEHPDCKNCPVYVDGDCDGSVNDFCVIPSVCYKCNGTGVQPEEMKSIEIDQYRLPKGWDENYAAFKTSDIKKIQSSRDEAVRHLEELHQIHPASIEKMIVKWSEIHNFLSSIEKEG